MYNTLYLSRRVNKRFLYRDVSAPGRAQPGGTRGAALGLRLSAAGFSLLFFRFLFFSLNDISTYFFSLPSESPAALRVRRRAPNGVGSAERPRGEGDTGRRWGMSVAFLPLRLALPVRVRAEPEPGGAAQNAEPRGRDGKRRAKGSARRGRGDKTDAEETSARRRAPRNAALAARPRLQLAPPRLRDGSAGGGPRAAGELRAVRGAGAAVAVCSVLRFSCQRRLKAALLSAVRAARGRTLTCARLFPNEIGSELSALSAVPPHTAARGSPGARGRAVGAEPRSVRGSAAGSTGRTGSAPPWDGFGKGAVRARGFPEGLAKQRPPARPSGRSTVRRGMGPGEFVSHPLFVWGRDVSCCGMRLRAGNPHLFFGHQQGTPAEMDALHCSLCGWQRPSPPARVCHGSAAQQSALRPAEGPSSGTAEPCRKQRCSQRAPAVPKERCPGQCPGSEGPLGALAALIPQGPHLLPVPGCVWPWGSGGWGRCLVSRQAGLGTSVFEAAIKVMVLSGWRVFPKQSELLHVSVCAREAQAVCLCSFLFRSFKPRETRVQTRRWIGMEKWSGAELSAGRGSMQIV